MGPSRRCRRAAPRSPRDRNPAAAVSAYPDAREQRPPLNVEIAIEGIVTSLRGEVADLSDVTLDTTGIPAFNQRVYEFARTIPRGETRTYGEVAAKLGASGAAHSVAQAIARNPFMIIVPCHRVLEAGSYATRSRRMAAPFPSAACCRSRAPTQRSKTLFDVLLPVAPPRPHA